MSFDVNYPDNPWEGLATNQVKKYDPILREFWVPRKVYSNFTAASVDTRGMPNTNSMEVTSIILPRTNTTPLSARQLWMDASRFDSASRTVSTQRNGAKVAYHDEDPLITYWRTSGGGLSAIRELVNRGLGKMMSEMSEILIRNAFLSNSYKMYGDGSGNSFNDVDTYTKRLTTSQLEEISLGMKIRGVPFAQGEGPAKLVAITTPSVTFDLLREASATGNEDAFIDVMKYAHAERIFKGEIGTYKGVRFIETNYAYLLNCGPIIRQTTITAAHNAGDGVNPNVKVDGVYAVGQTSGITNYIQLADVGEEGAEDAFVENDMISLHLTRGSTFGVPNGALYTEGTKFDSRIVAVDYDNNRIVLEDPLPWDFNTDLGSGVYGYATKARHLSTTTFIGGMDGVLQAIKHPPRLHAPVAVDDFASVHRFSFDQRIGYHVWEPRVFEVHVGAGTYRFKGAAVR